MLSWLKETRRPRISGGAISAIYMGASINDAPTPNPPIILAITNEIKLGAKAEATADIAYKIAAYRKTVRLPILSLNGPATIMANVAVRVSEATDHPNSSLLKPNSGSMNLTTPEITDASKPINSPPRATIRAIIIITGFFDFIV